MKAILFSFLLIFLLISCNEDMTQAQLTAKKMKADISATKENIYSISVFDFYDNTLKFSGTSYVFRSDGFIVITTNAGQSHTFNLGEIKSYSIPSHELDLYY